MILLMMLMLLLEVKNLIRKLITIMIMIINKIIMKTIVAIKTLLIVKIMSSCHCHHKTLKKLCLYLEIKWFFIDKKV